jgi:hypothetical protein
MFSTLLTMFLAVVLPAIGRIIGTMKDLRELKRTDLEMEERTAQIRLATDVEIEKYDPKVAALKRATVEPPSDRRVRSDVPDVSPLVIWLFGITLILFVCWTLSLILHL